MIKCPICKSVIRNIHKFSIHFRRLHGNNRRVVCPNKFCQVSFTKVKNLIFHLNRQHKSLVLDDIHGKTSHDPISIKDSNVLSDSFLSEVSGNEFQESLTDFKKYVACFMLGLQEKYLCQEEAINFVVEGITKIAKFYMDNARKCINSLDIDVSGQQELGLHMSDEVMISSVFDVVHSQYKLRKFCEETFNYIKPENKVIDEQKGLSAYLIPLDRYLQSILDEEKYSLFLEYRQLCDQRLQIHSDDDDKVILRDFTDGYYFKSNPILQSPDCFWLQFYVDEIDIVNPIGPARGLHKLMAVYMTISSFPPIYRIHSRDIHLVALIPYTIVSQLKNNFQKIFAP